MSADAAIPTAGSVGSNTGPQVSTIQGPTSTSSTLSFLEAMFGLQGKVIVVFGGTGELCGKMAQGFYDAGATCVFIVGRSREKAASLLEGRDPQRMRFHQFDATSDEVSAVLETALSVTGAVDVLVNGAGVNSATPFLDVSEEESAHIMNVNFQVCFGSPPLATRTHTPSCTCTLLRPLPRSSVLTRLSGSS